MRYIKCGIRYTDKHGRFVVVIIIITMAITVHTIIYIYTLFLPLFVLLPYRRYHYDFYKLFVRSHCSALQDAALSDPDMWICVRERTGRLIDLFWDDLTLYLESMVFDAKDSLGRWGWGGLHLSHLLDGW